MLSFEDVLQLLRQPRPPHLIAIDGLPCSGKSRLAEQICGELNFQCLAFDDFFMPKRAWPANVAPAFPFPFYRHAEFLDAVRQLAAVGSCSFNAFDWDTMRVTKKRRSLSLENGPIVVEGTSSLHPDIAPLYKLRIWIESDARSILAAIDERDGDFFESEWRSLFLPSVQLYMATNPRERADFQVRGRGAP